jgi:hypothetical protein
MVLVIDDEDLYNCVIWMIFSDPFPEQGIKQFLTFNQISAFAKNNNLSYY